MKGDLNGGAYPCKHRMANTAQEQTRNCKSDVKDTISQANV